MANLYVEFSEQLEGYAIFGGNLPKNVAWSVHESEGEALTEAHEIADDIGVEVGS